MTDKLPRISATEAIRVQEKIPKEPKELIK